MRGLLACLAVAGIVTSAHAAISINEIRIDMPSTDVNEYFELAGNPGESLAGLTYFVIGDGTGGSGVVERPLALSGAIPGDGYWLGAGDADTFGAAPDQNFAVAQDMFENSDNVTHVLAMNFTGTVGQDLDTNDDGVLDITPWDAIVDWVSLSENVPLEDKVYAPTVVGPDGTFAPGHVYRFPNGTGSYSIGQFDPVGGADTPGVANVPEPASLALLVMGGMMALRRRR